MTDSDVINHAVLQISAHFELDPVSQKSSTLETIKAYLIARLDQLLDQDPEKLKWILYRIDINEQEAMEAVVSMPQSQASKRLAQLIIDREIEKAKSRIKYRRNK